jgi:hypothetical protein
MDIESGYEPWAHLGSMDSACPVYGDLAEPPASENFSRKEKIIMISDKELRARMREANIKFWENKIFPLNQKRRCMLLGCKSTTGYNKLGRRIQDGWKWVFFGADEVGFDRSRGRLVCPKDVKRIEKLFRVVRVVR